MSLIAVVPIFAAQASVQGSDFIKVTAEVQEAGDADEVGCTIQNLNSNRYQIRPFRDTPVILDSHSRKTWFLNRDHDSGDLWWAAIPGLTPNIGNANCSPFEIYLGESNVHLRRQKTQHQFGEPQQPDEAEQMYKLELLEKASLLGDDPR